MIALLSGNEAFARGAYEAGICLVSSYPGTPSTEITETMKKYEEVYVEWATNEKVALEVAAGACFAGRRSMTCMKHVGLNVASDPLMTLNYTGVNGGLVIVVCDDPNMFSSQNEQDSRNYARFAKLPMLEPSDSAEAKDFIIEAFNLSEKYCCPVLIRSTTRISHSKSRVEIGTRVSVPEKQIEKDTSKWVMVPANARKRHPIVENRLKELAAFAEESTLNRIEYHSKNIGVICSGIAYQYVKEAMPDASILKLGVVYPLPFKKIQAFIDSVDQVYIIEELDPFLETEIKAHVNTMSKLKNISRDFCYELSVDIIKTYFNKLKVESREEVLNLPARPPVLCPGCSHRGIFYAINKLGLISCGDIGCYTLGFSPPLNALHTCLCMGTSISMAHGIDKATKGEIAKKTVAVIGDSTFFHTGINGLINAIYNAGSSTIIILNNSTTAMTGHQPNPGTGKTIRGEQTHRFDFCKIGGALGIKNITVVDPLDTNSCIDILKRECEKDEVSLIVTNRPCIYADKNVIKPPLFVDAELCKGCQLCIKVGCPAISFSKKDKRATIDETLCTGCFLCAKVCKFDAIKERH